MAISIQKISKKENKIKFLIKNIKYSIANALRRSAQEIPVLAIDTIEFYKNDSALSDEILAHRLGLVPLKSLSKGMVLKQNCPCKGKGCIRCRIPIKLKAVGPCTVYSKDLKMKGAEVIYKEMPLVILAKNQELEFTAEAVLGQGKKHAKFSPGLVYYNSYPIIEINECNACRECISTCPQKAITEERGRIKIDPLKCDLCELCIETCKKKSKDGKSAIKITPSENELIFTIESWGQLDPKELFIEAVKMLDENLKDFSRQIKKI